MPLALMKKTKNAQDKIDGGHPGFFIRGPINAAPLQQTSRSLYRSARAIDPGEGCGDRSLVSAQTASAPRTVRDGNNKS